MLLVKSYAQLLAFVVAMILAIVVANACSDSTCASDLDCDRGAFCIFRVGSCSQIGECMAEPAIPADPTCGGQAALCGCPGPKAITGCGYPDGFASSPTTGTSDLSLCTDAGPYFGIDASSDASSAANIDAGARDASAE